MEALLFWWAVFSAGVFLVVGGRRPSLAERVQALRPEAAVPQRPVAKPAVFSVRGLEGMRPALEVVGEWVGRTRRRLGLDADELARRLALAGRPEDLSVFFGTKVVYATLGLVLPGVLDAMGLLVPFPGLAGLALGAVAFFAPNWIVTEQARVRRVALEEGLVEAALAIASAMGAGSGLAEAVEEAKAGEGPFFEELERALAQAQLEGKGPAEALEALASRTGLHEAKDLASALRAADHGAPLTQTLLAQARFLAERHRLDSLAAGHRAEIRMHLVQAGLILPGFFWLVLYPVARTLTTFTGGR